MYLKVGAWGRILLVYLPPCCSIVSILELAKLVLVVVLESPWLVLGDFNVHAEALLSGVTQDVMSSMTTMGLSQIVSAPTHAARQTLDLIVCTGADVDDLDVEELLCSPIVMDIPLSGVV